MRRSTFSSLAFALSLAFTFTFALSFALSFAFGGDALARPGGGGSFSSHSSSGGGFHSSGGGFHSGSSSSSGGGGGGGGEALGELLGALFQLCARQPAVGFPLLAALIGLGVLFVRASRRARADDDWASSEPAAPPPPARRELERLRATDPEFSIVLMQDFVYALYAEVQAARGANQLDRLAPYLTPPVRAQLRSPDLSAVKDVVVGALRFAEVVDSANGAFITVGVELTTNLTEVARAGGEQSYYLREFWRLRRRRDARSRPPEKIRTFGCPNCGAALEALHGSQCTYCKEIVDTGRFDWLVVGVTVLERETRGPMLTGTTEEAGTSLPTIYDPALPAEVAALAARDPAFTEQAFDARVAHIFAELQVAWSNRDWLRARPYVSESLFQTQLYWMEAYRRARLRNITERARITRIELVRVGSDARYDAVTVRLFATGLDYTLTDEGGKVVAGSRTRERAYSEYWTLIRSAGRTGAPRADRKCPSCGADVKINMAGQCEFCKARLSSGDFDWVLSQIEQDEVYAG